MKRNFFSTLIIAVAAATFFASCDEHNEENLVKTPAIVTEEATSSAITIDGISQSTTTGILQFAVTAEKGAREQLFRHELGLLTSGFTTSYDEEEGLIVNGNGSSIWLQIYSKSQNLEEGIYSFTGSQDNGNAFDFWYGAVDADNQNYLFTEGQLIVAKKGEVYSIEVAGKITTAGSKEIKTIKGSYTGTIAAFEKH
jgi:hypothetical protein